MIIWIADQSNRNRPMAWVAIKKQARSLWLAAKKRAAIISKLNWPVIIGISLSWLAILLIARLLFGGWP